MMTSAARATARKAGHRTCLLPLSSMRFWRQAVPKICSVPECGQRCDKPYGRGGLCEKHSSRQRRTGTTDAGPRAHLPVEVRFWKFVEKAGPDDCWLWTGCTTAPPWRYGVIAAGKRCKQLRAHRVSWEIANGCQVPDGMVVMHMCDNPPCVNPAHLKLGTYAENTADMMAKGRKVDLGAPGVRNCNAVLTPDLVRYIRASDKNNQELADEIGVTRATVRKARLGLNWSHVT